MMTQMMMTTTTLMMITILLEYLQILSVVSFHLIDHYLFSLKIINQSHLSVYKEQPITFVCLQGELKVRSQKML